MPLPTLRITFSHRGPGACLSLHEHEALALALLGPCALEIHGRGVQGPDLDTQFQTIETASATWTRSSPNPPRARWWTSVERLDGTETWFAAHTHAHLELAGFDAIEDALALYERFRTELRSRGVRPLFYDGGTPVKTLVDAGEREAAAVWQRARIEALVDAEPLLDPHESSLSAAGLGVDAVREVAERTPVPERYRVLDLRRNDLTELPVAFGRFASATLLWLQQNPFTDGPTPQMLRALFPALRAVDLRDCPLAPGVADALVAAGYEVRM